MLGLVLTPLAALAEEPASSAASASLKADQAKLEKTEDETLSIQQQVTAVQASLKTIADKQVELNAQTKALAEQSVGLMPELQAKAAEHQKKQKALMDLMASDYKTPAQNGFFIAVSTHTISDSLDQAEYTSAFAQKMNSLAQAAASAKDDLAGRKQEIDAKRSQLELSQREQGVLKAGTDQQNAKLAELLANKNNEAAYLAAKIAKEKLAQDTLLSALADGASGATWGTYTDGARVKQGEAIGFEGSTGNSTGCHTHFSLIEGNKWINPQPFFDTAIIRHPDGGLTQAFGMTDYARSGAYGGNIHNGIDFVQGCSKPVRAAADGMIIRDNRTDGSGFGHYIMIRHANGLITLYGHLI